MKILKTISNHRHALGLAALIAISGSASAQFSDPTTSETFGGKAMFLKGSDRQPIQVPPNAPVQLKDDFFRWNEKGVEKLDRATGKWGPCDAPSYPPGTTMTMADGTVLMAIKTGGELSFALYPLSTFSLGGMVQVSKNKFLGGTDAIPGFILALDYTKFTKSGNFALGGWFYRQFPVEFATSTSGTYGGNLYDIHARLMKGGFGLQLSFYNDLQDRARTFGLYAIADISGHIAGSSDSHTIRARIGAGFLNNLTADTVNQSNPAAGAVIKRSSVNPSVFWQAGYPLNPKTSLIFSHWWVRNRNQDLSRFALGLGFKF